MKRNDIKALADKTVAELHQQLKDLKSKLALARIEKAARKPLAHGLPSAIGDDIARIKAVIAQKEMAAKVEKKTEEAEKTEKK